MNRQILFKLLFDKIGTKLTKILINYYNISAAYILKDNIKSEIFITTIGCKQGGPLSARLFSIYIEDVIEEVNKLNTGIKINSVFFFLLFLIHYFMNTSSIHSEWIIHS